jgi:hypothetical protein
VSEHEITQQSFPNDGSQMSEHPSEVIFVIGIDVIQSHLLAINE